MPKLQEIREKRANAAKRIREMADKVNAEGRDFTAEESAAWKQVNDEYNALKRQEEILCRAEEIDREQDRRQGDDTVGREDFDNKKKSRRDDEQQATEEDRALAMQAWCRRQMRLPLSERHREACRRAGVDPRSRYLDFQLRQPRLARQEQRALSVGTTTAGGYTVPEGFIYSLERSLLAYANVRQVADVLVTDTGNTLPWPTVNDTANSGELLAEGGSIGSSVDPTFGVINMLAYKYSSKPTLVSAELLEDSAFNLARELGSMHGERIGRIQGTHFTTGDNSSKPQGIVTASGLGKTAASATAIAADELFDLLHSIDPAYRSDPSFGFMMHDNILLAVRKLKDSQNRYLWQENMRVGEPDQLLGKPVIVNQAMQSSIATATKTILAGAFKKYKIRDVRNVRMRRLVERYADTDQEGFVTFMRSDGRLLDAGTDPVKHLIQA